MPALNISPLSVSFDSFANELKLLVSKKPDAFKDFFDTGAGSAVIDMAATLATFYFYHLVAQRRELLLSSAQDYSSLLGNAADKAYSAYRGSNLRGYLTVKPSVSVSVPKWTILGSYQEYDAVTLEDCVFTADTIVRVPVVIGKLREETLSVSATDVTIFSFTSGYVSEDYQLLLNNTVLPVSSEFKALLDDNYVAISNSYGAVDVYYLQNGKFNYKPTDTLTLRYIERNSGVNNSNFVSSNVIVSGTEVQGFTLISDFQPAESKSSIKAKAPLYNDTSNVVRARADFKKVIKSILNSIVSCEDIDVTPGLVALCALKHDETALTPEELALADNFFKTSNASGVALHQFIPPKLTTLDVKVVLTKDSTASADLTTSNKIQEELKIYEKVLKTSFDTRKLEAAIENIEGVEVATPTFATTAWQAKKSYLMSAVVIPTDFKNYGYTISSILNRTGTNEPTWGAETVYDNEVCWKKFNGSPVGVQTWAASKDTALLSFVQDSNTGTVYQCDHFIHRTGTTQPTWGAEYVVDNEVYWHKVSSGSNTAWAASKDTLVGDTIKVTISDGNAVAYYACVGYAHVSEASEPTWGDLSLVTDGRINWLKSAYPVRRINLFWDTYAKINLTLEVED